VFKKYYNNCASVEVDYILKTWKRDVVIDKEKWFFQIRTKCYKKKLQEFTNQQDYEARSVLRRFMNIFSRHPFVLSLTKGKREMTHLKLP